MNYGIKAAKGNIIMRIDAHSHFEPNYVSVLSKALIDLKATNVGAVCKTDVINKNPKSLAIREVLSNKFGVGRSEEHTSELQSRPHLVCRLLLEKKNTTER